MNDDRLRRSTRKMATDDRDDQRPLPRAKPRSLQAIAYEIMRKWANPHYSAIPYINAMTYLTDMASSNGHDDAEGIVLRFLDSAATWRGEDARRIKAELRAMLPKRSAR